MEELTGSGAAEDKNGVCSNVMEIEQEWAPHGVHSVPQKHLIMPFLFLTTTAPEAVGLQAPQAPPLTPEPSSENHGDGFDVGASAETSFNLLGRPHEPPPHASKI